MSETTPANKTFIQTFRESSPYINSHRGKTMVLLLDGFCLQSDKLTQVIYDIALMHSLGIKIVLVMGTRPLISDALTESGISSQMHLGQRITSSEILHIAKQVSGEARFKLEALFSAALPNTPLQGSDIKLVGGNFITAKPLGVLEGKDFQFTGEIRKVDCAAIQAVLEHNAIVLLSNIAGSVTGESFNVAAEHVATAVAKSIGADKFIIVSQAAELRELERELTLQQALQISQPSHNLSCLINTCKAGIPRCHMVSVEQDGALLTELFTTDGSGVLLSKNPYESIRPASAEDIGGIMQLLQPLESSGFLVKREPEVLEQEMHHFIVIERDNKIIACSALYPFIDDQGLNMAEIACVATDPDYQGGQRGAEMLAYLAEQAAAAAIDSLFVLTTQSLHFFLEQGFIQASVDDLPQQKQAMYNYQRNSKVLIKQL
ncbi:MAG: amino-acid N-acetyltransferase [Pseudomonadales bacterium]|nr:amino-acid N-acetyltransferase [Pseudomonadales bacterium]